MMRRFNIASEDRLAARQYRRARGYSLTGDFDGWEWEALKAWFGGVCLACGVDGPLSVDHVVPLVKGGSGFIHNVQPLCLVCNSRKGQDYRDYRDPLLLVQLLELVGG